MDEPDGWWGHVPVISKPYTNLGEYWEWHKQQLDDALMAALLKYPAGLAVIPESGFYIMAARKIAKYRDGREDNLQTIVAMWEDDEDIAYPQVLTGNIVVRGGIEEQDLNALGKRHNPFTDLFEKLAANVPKEWPEYLRWRRRQPRKPVPEWLLNLRAKERPPKGRRNWR
jgi:hypothetical protein